MFSDPQFWVAVSFFLFIAAIFNPVRKLLISSLDSQINEIRSKINEAESLKIEAQKTLNELKTRETEVEKEIQTLQKNSEEKIKELEILSSKKLSDQIEKRKKLADNKIDQLLRDTNITIKNYISNTAIESTIGLLQKNLSKEIKSDLISQSIGELNKVIKR